MDRESFDDVTRTLIEHQGTRRAVLRLLAGDGPGFDALIGSLRVTDEISQAGVEQAPPAIGTPR